MALLKNLTLKAKLRTIVMITSGLVILLTSAVAITYELVTFRKDTVEKLTSLANVVGFNVTAAIMFNDPDTATELLSGLSAEHSVQQAVIFSITGEPFSSYTKSDRVEPLKWSHVLNFTTKTYKAQTHFDFHDRLLDLVVPIVMADKKIGWVAIRSDMSDIFGELRWFILLIAMSMGFCFLIAVLLASRLQRVISTPIGELADTIEVVSNMKDYTIRAKKSGEDELGVLIDGFNDMLQQIQNRNKAIYLRNQALQKSREDLKNLVDLRTRELRVSENQKRQLVFQQKIQSAYSQLVGILNSIDLSEILEKSLNHIAGQAESQWAGVFLVDEGSKVLKIKKTFIGSDLNMTVPRLDVIDKMTNLIGPEESIKTIDNPFGISGVASEKVSMATFPLSFQKTRLGVLVLINPDSSLGTKVFLNNAVRQLEIAIHNAMTFQILQFKSAQLKMSNIELEAASQAKSDFLANMSHELRTPLNAIIGFSEVLSDQYFGELNANQKEYIQDILKSGEHLLALINDILDLSKVEAGKMEIDALETSITELIGSSVTIIKEKCFKKGLEIKVKSIQQPELFKCDERKVKQILFNLLSNAVKFTEKGGTIHLDVTKVASDDIITSVPALFKKEVAEYVAGQDRQYMQFSVSDTGIGIKPESLKTIFEAFQQEEKTTSRKYGGTGLGLALCKMLVELHGGRIWVKSSLSKGSTFTFILPVIDEFVEGEKSSVGGSADGVALAGGRTPRIMVVEDDEKMNRRVVHLLEEQGYEVDAIIDGKKVLEAAKATPPDLILLDVMLPEMDGWEIWTEIKQCPETNTIPVVICSAIEDRSLAFSLGAFDYLVKPVKKEDLLRCLSNAGLDINSHASGEILFIGEDSDERRHYEKILRQAQLKFQMVPDGNTALGEIEKSPPALIIQDLKAQNENDLTFIRRLKALEAGANIPVIALIEAHVKGKAVDNIDREFENEVIPYTGVPDKILNRLSQTPQWVHLKNGAQLKN